MNEKEAIRQIRNRFLTKNKKTTTLAKRIKLFESLIAESEANGLDAYVAFFHGYKAFSVKDL